MFLSKLGKNTKREGKNLFRIRIFFEAKNIEISSQKEKSIKLNIQYNLKVSVNVVKLKFFSLKMKFECYLLFFSEPK